MKRVLLLVGAVCVIQTVFGQTTLNVDANGVLNSSKIVTQTTGGQVFFTGHQLGSTYSMPAGIFRAVTDNANGAQNYFYDGLANGVTTFSIRADGQGYFAGNVGIGTTNPSAKLSVAGGNLLMDNAAWHTSKNASGATTSILGIGFDNNIYMGDLFGNDPTGNIILRTNGTNKMMITPNGNVGIGTISPDATLAVNGTIHSKAVNIDLNGWSDYVFKKEYQLKPLSEVKKYIDQNQHLPEIPSEQEMIKKGLDIGEMNKLLMKKVEELTLYLIEKDQKEVKQSEINQVQEERIHKLEQQLGLLINKSTN